MVSRRRTACACVSPATLAAGVSMPLVLPMIAADRCDRPARLVPNQTAAAPVPQRSPAIAANRRSARFPTVGALRGALHSAGRMRVAAAAGAKRPSPAPDASRHGAPPTTVGGRLGRALMAAFERFRAAAGVFRLTPATDVRRRGAQSMTAEERRGLALRAASAPRAAASAACRSLGRMSAAPEQPPYR